MTNPASNAVPAPGSEAARKQTVHLYVHIGGNFYEPVCKSYRLGKFTTDIRLVTCKRCIKLHAADPLDNLTMRPRTDAETGGPHA